MQHLVFLCLSLFAIALAQTNNRECSLEGTVFRQGATFLNVGYQALNFYPMMFDLGSGELYFMRWSYSYDGLSGSVIDAALQSTDDTTCELYSRGSYVATFNNDCTNVVFTPLGNDECTKRTNLFSGTWTAVRNAACDSIGFGRAGTLAGPANGQAAAILYASSNIVITSLNGEMAVYDQIQPFSNNPRQAIPAVIVKQIAADPDRSGCNVGDYGHYFIQRDSGCGIRFCLQSDACAYRGAIFGGSTFGYTGGETSCPAVLYDDCSAGLDQWTGHPYECINQPILGGCAFCGGRAIDSDIKVCINRRGLTCQDMFESPSIQSVCNLAFECNRHDLNGSGISNEEAILAEEEAALNGGEVVNGGEVENSASSLSPIALIVFSVAAAFM
jgi:hypothetical protein